MFAALIPPWVALAEGPLDAAYPPPWPEEGALVAHAVESRRTEFAVGRALARRALEDLGAPAGPLLAGPDRAPVWPKGFTGSITHSRRHVAAVVARTTDALSLGIDVETIGRFRPGLERHLVRPDEAAMVLDGLDAPARQATTAVIFSAKEAFYKAQHPLSHQALGFQDARVAVDAGAGTFRLTLLRHVEALAGMAVFEGRFALEADTVAALVVIKAVQAEGRHGQQP